MYEIEILQAKILEWVAMPSSREYSQPRNRTHISYISWIGRKVKTWLVVKTTSTAWEPMNIILVYFSVFLTLGM